VILITVVFGGEISRSAACSVGMRGSPAAAINSEKTEPGGGKKIPQETP